MFAWGNGQTHKEKTRPGLLLSAKKHAQATAQLKLTFAGLYALNPSVARFVVASNSTFLVPSTTRSTTTDSPGFLERAAVWTCHNRGGDV